MDPARPQLAMVSRSRALDLGSR